MMIFLFEFLILSTEIFFGVYLTGKRHKGNGKKYAVLGGMAASAALLLCFYNSVSKSPALSAVILLAGILLISKILYPWDWKLLLYSGCSYLSALFLVDTVSYLLLCRYFSVPLVFWLIFSFCFRVLFYIALFTSNSLEGLLKTPRQYYKTLYGTSVAAFCGISIMLHLSFVRQNLKTPMIISILVLSVLFLRIVLGYTHVKYQREKELLATIEMQKELLEQNYTAVNRAYSQNARLFHDFHRHLEVIRQLTQKYNAPELSEYIDSVISPVRDISSMAWTGDQTVDYILNSRYAKAAEAGIPMEMNIEYPYNTNIKANDLCTILSNLLDNALEAAAAMSRQCPPDRCRITLTIRRIGNILVIKLENSSPQPSYTPDGELTSAKKGLLLHGWGMKNIESAVQKYEGMIQTAYADHIFQTTITMCFDGVKMDAAEP